MRSLFFLLLAIVSILAFGAYQRWHYIVNETAATNQQQTAPVYRASDDMRAKQLCYTSLMDETTLDQLTVHGVIPTWISGSYYYNGPAQHALNDKPFNQLFDGFAMIHRFSIHNGTANYANKFIDTSYRANAQKNGSLPLSVTGSDKPKSFFSKCSAFFAKPPIYDNTNVNIIRFNHTYIALTETPHNFYIDPHTLKTLNAVTYDDKLDGHVCTAHPLYDIKTQDLFNVLTQFGNTSYYHVYRQSLHDPHKRKIVASIAADYPSYIHSFAMTDRYIVLTLVPFMVNPYDLLWNNKPFLKNFSWQPQYGTEFVIINKQTGTIRGRYKTESFFLFHHVNAFEQHNAIVVDAITYDDANVVGNMALEKIGCIPCNKPGRLTRYTINMHTNVVQHRPLCSLPLETPRINEARAIAKPYTFCYAITGDDKTLVKINLDNEKVLKWYDEHCFINEPTFVPHPKGLKEDDGVVMAIGLNTQTKKSFLLILDGKTLKEVARIMAPHHIPCGFHGNFFYQKM